MSDILTSTSLYRSSSVTKSTADWDGTLIYEVPPNFDTEITLLMISNSKDSDGFISVQVYHDDDNRYTHLLRSRKVPANESLSPLVGSILNLHSGDKVFAYKNQMDIFDVSLSGRQYYNPMR